MTTTQKFDFAPSAIHQKLTRGIRPEMSYAGGDVAKWQRALRRKVRELLGMPRMPALGGPLRSRPLWKRDHEFGTIEKLVFTAEPGADVPAYLCVPHHPLAEPPPVFICLQGHSTGMHRSIAVRQDESAPEVAEGDRDFAIGCMRRGIAALAIEQRAFGERVEPDPQRPDLRLSCDDAAKHALMLGRTLAGERVFDVARSIEWLKVRGGFDLTRLGVMGNSGGGTVSIYAGAVLPEIKYMIPSCSFSTHAASIMAIRHCVDNYIPQLLCYGDSADVLGLFAPRPVVVVAGRDDDIFPIAGVKKAFAQLKKIYAAAGAADQCKLVIGQGGHRFYADDAWKPMVKMLGGKR